MKKATMTLMLALTLMAGGCDTGSSAEAAEPSVEVVTRHEAAPEPAASPRAEAALATVAPTPAPTRSILSATPAPTEVERERLYPGDGLVRVRRATLTREVEDREPVDTITSLAHDEPQRVYVFLDVANETDEEQPLEVVFEHQSGHTAGHVEVTVPAHASRWRTWAFSRNVTARPGEWTAVVRDAGGSVVAELDMSVR